MKYKVDCLMDEVSVQGRVEELGRQITKDFKDTKQLVVVGLLRGSVVFIADLIRKIDLEVSIDFMVVSSYGKSMESSRDVKILKDLEDPISGKDVLIVEDILDTGHTLNKVYNLLKLRNPKSLHICTLLDKPERREVDISVSYIGFSIPDEFVVGYGIDYAEKHRNLPFVGKVVPQ